MSTAAMIGLGILIWVLVSILLALFLGRMIQLRDRQRPHDRQQANRDGAGRSVQNPAGDRAGATSRQARHGWGRRN